MTREEARKRAEHVVYVRCTLQDIIDRCERADIKTHTPKGKLRNRCTLEKELIEHYTDYYAED